MIKKLVIIFAALLLSLTSLRAQEPESSVLQEPVTVAQENTVKKVLFIGDSMTGWLSEALNAYGKANGFEVATIVWDGSTINKWGNSPKLASIIKEQNPDAVFVSLGMNELFEANPATRFHTSLNKIRSAVGDRPLLWVGPPSWPGHNKGEVLNDWLEKELGSRSFFRSFDLNLQRQSNKNPHPTRQGIIKWVDEIMKWAPDNSDIPLPKEMVQPGDNKMVRGKTFIYKRMKETL